MTPAFRDHIEKLVVYFQPLVLASEYDIDVVFKETVSTDNESTAATMRIDEIYLNATMTIFPPTFEMWKDGNYMAVAKVICHEWCHILTEPLYALALSSQSPITRPLINEVRERQTERLSKAIFALVPKPLQL